MSPRKLISKIEAMGGSLVLDGEGIVCDLPAEAEQLLPELRRQRAAVHAALAGREQPKAIVEVEVACRCSKWPFPHVHNAEDRRRAMELWNRDYGRIQ